jgi:hypothetical protein
LLPVLASPPVGLEIQAAVRGQEAGRRPGGTVLQVQHRALHQCLCAACRETRRLINHLLACRQCHPSQCAFHLQTHALVQTLPHPNHPFPSLGVLRPCHLHLPLPLNNRYSAPTPCSATLPGPAPCPAHLTSPVVREIHSKNHHHWALLAACFGLPACGTGDSGSCEGAGDGAAAWQGGTAGVPDDLCHVLFAVCRRLGVEIIPGLPDGPLHHKPPHAYVAQHAPLPYLCAILPCRTSPSSPTGTRLPLRRPLPRPLPTPTPAQCSI